MNPLKSAMLTALPLLVMGCWNLTLGEREPDRKDTSSGDATGSDTQETDGDAVDSDDIAAHPCMGVRCDAEVDGRCDQRDTVVRPTEEGYCTVRDGDPECVYPEFIEACERGSCLDGTCPEVPAQGTRCHDPDPPYCEDNRLIVSMPGGRAVTQGFVASCVYSKTEIPCAAGCQDGRCIGDPCAGVFCHAPPARFCIGDHLVTWSPFGYCGDDGTCRYDQRVVSCEAGCDAGHCREDRSCAMTRCTRPPANFCLDDATLFSYGPVGYCESGACIYTGERIDCPCLEGQCTTDPCAGVHCTTPPPMRCGRNGAVVRWDGNTDNVCLDGVCLYGTSEVACDAGVCSDGRCADPCIGMAVYCNSLPGPSEFCDENTAVSYDTAAACVEGGCDWHGLTETCLDCEEGRCAEP